MKVVIASVDQDGDLMLVQVEAANAATALMKHVVDTIGYDDLEVEDDTDPQSIIDAIEQEGDKIDFVIVT